ncbi:hypothetical protein COU48_01390, partial [Candidatus Nomurabacteria bacterium CG10_big_fil_rev_8_21_14_0_10_03_31_7]
NGSSDTNTGINITGKGSGNIIFNGTTTGNVGIGTTNPGTKLEIGSSDLGDGVAGPVITIGRNTNATNTGAGSINFLGKAGTAGYVWQDAAGKLRINTSAPSNANDTAGTVVGDQTSTRDTKQDIEDYTNYSDALSMILDAPLHTFRYKKEVAGYGTDSPLAKVRIGYIADEVSPMFMVGNSIDQVSVNGLLIASIKELDLKINDLSTTQIGTPTTSLGQYASMFFSDVIYGVEQSTVYIRGLVVDTLKVGSREKRTGITLYDEVSGDPYCISVANGASKTTAGECVVITPPEPIINSGGGGTPAPAPNGDGLSVAPSITLNGAGTINLNVGDIYNEEGAVALDDVDLDVAIIISGYVDTSIDSTNTITYSATDSGGNTSSTTRTVIVGTGTPPVLPITSLPEPEPIPAIEPVPVSEPIPEPEPIPAIEPVPVSEPIPEPAPVLEPAPAPAPAPVPAP